MQETQVEQKKDYCADGKSYYQGGKFYPDQTPLEIPLGYDIPETLESMIARMVHNERFYNNEEIDNVDEADDLDVMDEEPILASRHEFTEMQEETYIKEKKAALKHADDRLNPPVVETTPVLAQPPATEPNPPKGGQQ